MPHRTSPHTAGIHCTQIGAPGSFVGNRIRLQRLTDAKFFSGWVVSCVDEVLRIKLNGEPELEPGQEFAGEAHGAVSVARFRMKLESLEDQPATFRLTAPIHHGAGVEQARYIVVGINCSFFLGSKQMNAEVTDFSALGLGIRLSRSVMPGTDVELSVTDGKLTVGLDAQIRHCRLDPEAPGYYRAGMLLCPNGPEQAYAWESFRSRLMDCIDRAA